ncbi:MAG: protein kinase domain-containing protein [Gammaproteobacteria bacterium]
MPLRILIIDDHRDYRAWLGHHLAAACPDAEIVGHDPADGERLPAEFNPADWGLVFLDHRLGRYDGLALLAELKAQPACPPIVFLTPQGDRRAVVRALQAGADDFLPKGRSSHEHIRRVVREAVRGGEHTSRPAATAPPPAGQAFALKGHRVLNELGSGSTASVYLMERCSDERLAVAKVFRQVPDAVDQSQPLQRFLREYEVISGIRHANVVRIFDLGIADDMAYIVMEYFAGGHLGERLGAGLPPRTALGYLAQIAGALDAIHGVGILHRDLKPANIMLRDDATPVLIDFGVASLRDPGAERAARGEVFGTPYYMSPEQGEGRAVDERADLYSLGVVFYELLTGRKPYVGGSPVAVIGKHRHAPLPALPPGCEACQPLLDRLMAKRPADRFASAAALLEALDPALHKPA